MQYHIHKCLPLSYTALPLHFYFLGRKTARSRAFRLCTILLEYVVYLVFTFFSASLAFRLEELSDSQISVRFEDSWDYIL